MGETIQSLSICCPAKGGCINHCKTCTARQHENPYENKYCGNHMDTFEYWQNVIKRMKYALSKGCTTVMLTGSNEPQQDRRWLEGLYLAMQSLPEKFLNIEIQTTGAFIDEDYMMFLKNFGVTTVALSTYNIHSDIKNRNIIETRDKYLSVEQICKMVKNAGMNLRICINVTDTLRISGKDMSAEKTLKRCSELGADQVTFRKMWAVEGTPEGNWIKENTQNSDAFIDDVKATVKTKGSLINILPYGAERYDCMGFSIVVDTDSMAKDKTNIATKYYIIRENGKMYSAWDSAASLVF